MLKKVYIVERVEGEITIPVKAFAVKSKAESFVNKKNDEIKKIKDELDKIECDPNEVIVKAFEAYLKDTDVLYYEVLLSPPEIFDWDDYYDRRDTFMYNRWLLIEWATKAGFDDKTLSEVETYLDYSEIDRGVYYYLSHAPIEVVY
ncbi:MAG: hypothetical protein J6Y37_12025 [Paludibacteraceae bacterium]|nr:hypothetical protein [Paludibacteraceae bacterium]